MSDEARRPRREFGNIRSAKGAEVILRAPRWDDLDDLLAVINSLVVERAPILRTEPVSREEEIDWLARVSADIERGRLVCVCAEMGGHVVGTADVRRSAGVMRHVGYLGIALQKDARGQGIGSAMMRVLVEESRRLGLRLVVLDVYVTNDGARRLYERFGFREVGTLPKGIERDGSYIDEIRMALEL